jgi:hypothetical protein
MLRPEAFDGFIDYIDPDTFTDTEGNMVDLKDRSLLPSAPLSALKAFDEYKKLMAQHEKKGIIA